MMENKFEFKGTTTFINQPKDTVIKNFQNTYINGNLQTDGIINDLQKLIGLIIDSKDLTNDKKDEAIGALKSLADEVKGEKPNKLTLRAILSGVQEVISKASDIVVPAAIIIQSIASVIQSLTPK
jgi:hypothetical protein